MIILDTSLVDLKFIRDYDFKFIVRYCFSFKLEFSGSEEKDLILKKNFFSLFNKAFIKGNEDYFLQYRVCSNPKKSKSFKSKLKSSGFYYDLLSFDIKDGFLEVNVSTISNIDVSIDFIIKNIINSIRSSSKDFNDIRYSRNNTNIALADLKMVKCTTEWAGTAFKMKAA